MRGSFLVQRCPISREPISEAASQSKLVDCSIRKTAPDWEGFVMAMDPGSKGSLKAEINVTPLVDVMLVLLIIMMLIAPMLGKVAVSLPAADNSGEKPDTQSRRS